MATPCAHQTTQAMGYLTVKEIDEIINRVCQQLNIPISEAPVIKSSIKVPIEVSIESFTKAPIKAVTETPIEAFAEAPIKVITEKPVIKSYDETPVEAAVMKAFTKSVAQNLATTSCSGMATMSLLQAKYLVKMAPFVHLVLHTCAAVFVFDSGGTNVSNPPAVIPRFF